MNAIYPSLVIAVLVFISFQFLHFCCRALVTGLNHAADRWRAGRNWLDGRDHEQDRCPSPN